MEREEPKVKHNKLTGKSYDKLLSSHCDSVLFELSTFVSEVTSHSILTSRHSSSARLINQQFSRPFLQDAAELVVPRILH